MDQKRTFLMKNIGADDKIALVDLLRKCDGDFDLQCGSRIIVDAKSLLGVLSMDLSRDAELIVYNPTDSVINQLDKYIIA